MAGYRRFIAYVYEYRKGKKENNCGFIKVEVRNSICTIEIHLHVEGLAAEEEARVFCFLRKEGLMNGILIGSCMTQTDRVDCLIETNALNMGDSGTALGKMGGMVILTKSGGFFGSGESTGSVGVVTINMPRIAYLAKDKKDFFDRLDKLMDIAARSLKIKRTVITKLLDNGLYPYTKRYLGTFNNHFSTIGLVGMNEAGLNAKWLRKDLTHKETQDFTVEVLNHMRERLSDYQEQYGDLYNLEATPAESTSFRLAKHDVKRFPGIITAAKSCDDTPYYTNSSHLPVGYTEDIFSALDVQDELQTLYTSGTVFHAFLGEKLPDWKAAANLVRKIAENYKLPYYTMSPTYSVCKTHGYLSGEQKKCPICGETTEIYSRITGYYRPVQNWNDGKTQEYKDRKVYDIGRSTLTHHGVIGGEDTKTVAEKITEAPADESIKDGNILFVTATCPNCKIACATLDKAGVEYTKVYANEQPDFAKELGVKQAPTLVVIKDGQAEKFSGVSDIKKHLN